MTSNIKIKRICQFCSKEFTARTTVTLHCSPACAKRAYKARKKAKKIEISNQETMVMQSKPYDVLNAKEFLTVREVATLLNCSIRTTYRLIDFGTIKAVNLSIRKTLIRRSDIEMLFDYSQLKKKSTPHPPNIPEKSYSIHYIRSRFEISDSALHNIIKRNNIPVTRKGKYAYVPKVSIDELLDPKKS